MSVRIRLWAFLIGDNVSDFSLPSGYNTVHYTWNIRAANDNLRVVLLGDYGEKSYDAAWQWWLEYRHVIDADKSEWRRLLAHGAESHGAPALSEALERAAKVYHEDWRYLLCEAAAIDMRSEPQVCELYRRLRGD